MKTHENKNLPNQINNDNIKTSEYDEPLSKSILCGLQEAVEISRGNIPLTQVEGMPAPTFTVGHTD